MSSIDEIRLARLKKLELLKDSGINPYPSKVPKTISLGDAHLNFGSLVDTSKQESLAGRIMAIRGQGAIFFVVLDDGTDKFQAVFKKDEIDEKVFDLFVGAVDIGDIISVTGTFFTTQRGEQSILVKSWTIATKSLLPLPEKWHGIADEDERLRKRYLDMAMNPELRELFIKKAKFWKATREFLEREGFIEVQTPTLEVTTGGAEATPFKTHINDHDMDVYLRISIGELWQKRLMAAGFPKTYEIGRAYRNEGSSPEHLQEFTNMEFYAAYTDFEEGKELVKNLYKFVAKESFDKTDFETRGHKFNLSDEWQDLDYVDTIAEKTGVNVLESDIEELKAKLEELGVKYDGDNRERLTDALWKYCRKTISGPAFLINHPKLVAPLSNEHPDDPRKTKTFQVIIAGSEIGRAHSELNNPMDQQSRFDEQQKLLESGDMEAMMPDTEYVEMLEHGMPPTFGFGFGERLFAFMADKPMREVTLFPLLKPRE